MALNYEQKQYIKKNIRRLPVSKIAADSGLPENEILDYLKKKWPREKYKKFLQQRFAGESAPQAENASFNFSNFVRKNRMILVFLVALVFAVYANSLGNGFVSDDIGAFLSNPNFGHFSNVFSGPAHFSIAAFLQYIFFHIGGIHPFVFRTINILSHLGCVILIYMLLALSEKKRIAAVAAALFAAHPIFTESVSWISGGIYSLYAFFFLLSFLFYLFSESNRKYFYYSIVFYILAILSSEKALVLFLIFALYELAFGSLRYNWKKIAPFVLISFLILFLYIGKIGYRVSAVETQTYQPSSGLYNPLVQIPVAIGTYLKLIFWPARLTLYQTEMAFTQIQYAVFVLIFLVYLGAVAWSYFKNRTIFFWLVFFFIALLPTLTPFKISWVVAERYVYLGALGIIVAFAILLDKFFKLNENAKMVGYFALVLIIGSLSVRTIIRNMDWKSEDTLWLATAQVAPSGQQIHNNLGDVYMRQGNPQKAIEEFQKAIEINPNYADAYHNLGNTYQQIGEIDEAIPYYQKALEINPNLWQSYQNLAAIYFNSGDYEKALENIKKALEIDPQNQNLRENLKVIEENIKRNQQDG
jgi:tetratricopeptide (TPR) repeat protein